MWKFYKRSISKKDYLTFWMKENYLLLDTRFGNTKRTLLIGSVYGTRTRGRPKTRLSDNIKEMCGLTMVELERKAQDRNEWRCFVQRATAVRHQTPRT